MKEFQIASDLRKFLKSDINVTAVIIEPTANGFSLFIEFKKIDKQTVSSSECETTLGCDPEEDASESDENQTHIAKYSYSSLADLDDNISEVIRKIKNQRY